MAFTRVLGLTIAIATIAGLNAACSSLPEGSSGAPPLKYCGKTLWNGAAGAVPTRAYLHRTSAAVNTAGVKPDNYYVWVSRSCRRGSHVDLTAVRSAVVRVIHSKDGLAAAVVLGRVKPGATVTFTTSDHHTHVLTFPPSGSSR